MNRLMFRAAGLNRAWPAVFLAIVFLMWPRTSAAAGFLGSPADCAVALKKDLSQVIKTANQQYAFLNVIDQETFDALKVSAGASFSYGLISGSANFQEFQQKRTAFFQKVGYNSSSAQSESELHIVTAEAGYKAFTACMETLARNSFGFFAYKTAETKTAVVIEYTYHPTPGVTAPLSISGTVVNGTVPGVARGRLFPPGTTILANGSGIVQVLRTSNDMPRPTSGCTPPPAPPEMSVTLGGGGVTATVTAAWSDPSADTTGTAQVILSRLVKSEQRTQAPPAVSGWTDNNNNRGCGHAPCSSDGKWQATRVELRIAASPGSTLTNPRFTCESSADPGVCAHVDVDNLDVRNNAQVAYLNLRASSRPARFTLWADQVTQTSAPHDEPQAAQTIQACGFATFPVPTAPDIVGAVISASYKGPPTVVKPGSNSVDGHLVYLDKVPSASTTYFLYRIAD